MARLAGHTYAYTQPVRYCVWHNQRHRRYTIGWPVRLGRHTHLCVIVFPLSPDVSNAKSMDRFELNFVWNCVYHRIMIDIHNAVFSVVYFLTFCFNFCCGHRHISCDKRSNCQKVIELYNVLAYIRHTHANNNIHIDTPQNHFVSICVFFGRFGSLLPFFCFRSVEIPFFPLNID